MSRFDEVVVAPDRDPWLQIRPLVDAFNKRRQEVVVPGEYVTVDESMSVWRGASGRREVQFRDLAIDMLICVYEFFIFF
jgi:hypothetical protein